MPGILPMKVIKIGSNAQTRIAQACDRCRSKKIRCDGIRPCCTQCANVGFECKTSDKLSRRAFPRGYTESLEERVRSLETEVRELKDLLDEKDEKIDMLSRIHAHSSQRLQTSSLRRNSRQGSQESRLEDVNHSYDEPDEVFRIKQQSPSQGSGQSSSPHSTSSPRSFLESFKRRAKDHGHDVNVDGLLAHKKMSIEASRESPAVWTAPPRLLSDQLVNVFFQEWAPLFPVLHRPAFLTVYERYVANAEAIVDRGELAHLNLVFSIAALSSSVGEEELESMEAQWRMALEGISKDDNVQALQGLVLAQIYCLQKGDLVRLAAYKDLAMKLSSRLGLHRSQKTSALDTLAIETRKKLFWTLYTVDCFSAVVLGLPKHIKDDEVTCEYPVDADDEYVTEAGFLPSLPGESTKLSAGLALFKAARVLSRVLDQVFPARFTYQLSLRQLYDLSDELELWEASLPGHLRMQFAQDKPSTGTITSRSPILSLAYHYIRALIQRPAICSNTLGAKASTAMMTHADSCKKIVQIVELLKERGLGFSLCLNKDEVLVTAGMGLLMQRMQLDASSKTSKDNEKTIATVVDLLAHDDADCAGQFKEMVQAMLPELDLSSTIVPVPKLRRPSKPSMSRSSSDRVILLDHASTVHATARKQLKAIASRFSQAAKVQIPRRSLDSLEVRPPDSRVQLSTSPSLSNGLSTSPLSEASLHLSLSQSPISSADSRSSIYKNKRISAPSTTNLDYLSFDTEPGAESTATTDSAKPIKSEPSPTDWERLLGNLDNGVTNIFDASYGGPAIEALATPLLDYEKRSSALAGDALACDAGQLSLQPSKLNLDSPLGTISLSDDSSGIADDRSADWLSLNSAHDNEPLTTLALTDFDADFGIDAGIEW